MTQQNAALVEQAAAAAQSMQDQAAGLGRAVSVFKMENVLALAEPTMPASNVVPLSKKAHAVPLSNVAPERAQRVNAGAGHGDDWEEF